MPPTLDAPLVSVTGEVVVTAPDVSRAIGQLPLFRRRWLYLAGAGFLVAVLAAAGHVSLSALTPFLLFTAVFQAFVFLGPHLLAKRTLAAMPDRTMRYRADAGEITIATTGSTVTRRWDRITHFREEKTAFLIWVGPYAVQVIPKRAFSPDDQAWLRETLRREVKPVKAASKGRWRIVLLWLGLVVAFLVIWQILQGVGPGRAGH